MKKLCVEFLHFWPWRPLVVAEKTPLFLYYAIQICYNHTQKDKFNPPNVMSNVLIQEHFSSHDCETDSNVTDVPPFSQTLIVILPQQFWIELFVCFDHNSTLPLSLKKKKSALDSVSPLEVVQLSVFYIVF